MVDNNVIMDNFDPDLYITKIDHKHTESNFRKHMPMLEQLILDNYNILCSDISDVDVLNQAGILRDKFSEDLSVLCLIDDGKNKDECVSLFA